MNITEKKTLTEVKNVCMADHSDNIVGSRMCIINHEFNAGFKFMQEHPKSVTVFGSARLPESNIHSENATELSRRLAEKEYAVVTGGGPGIMHAANKGAHLGNGASLGLNIELPFEQTVNPYTTHSMDFHHFFSRKVILAYSAEAYVYFAGGFGTLDELFEILTLKQTKKIPNVPVILFGTSFWGPLDAYIKTVLLNENATISAEDIDLYTVTDDIDEAINIITAAPIRGEISARLNIQ